MVLNRAKCFNCLNDDFLHDSSDDIMIQVRNLDMGFIIEIVVKWHSELFNERFDEQSHAREQWFNEQFDKRSDEWFNT